MSTIKKKRPKTRLTKSQIRQIVQKLNFEIQFYDNDGDYANVHFANLIEDQLTVLRFK